jgi:ubiquinone/menaquinone biosynthesis C-methylase UbiE
MDDENVDAIVCATVLCSVDSIAEALAEFKRVLKPGEAFASLNT